MSKSYNNTLPIFAEEKPCQAGVRLSPTAPLEDPKDPDTCNLFQIYQHFGTPERAEEVRQSICRWLAYEAHTGAFENT